jgi:hypothetical protein
LYFIKYHNAMCFPYNIDFNQLKEVLALKIVIKVKKGNRKFNQVFLKKFNADTSFYFIYSLCDFHRTRLQNFPNNLILDINDINKKSLSLKLTISDLRNFLGRIRTAKD